MALVAIVPTLNEEKGLPKVLKGLKGRVDEIVVVDGGSRDRTVEIARGAGCTVVAQEGKGKGMGFQSFLKKYPVRARDFYVMLDADASYNPAEIGKLTKLLEDGADVVTGTRMLSVHDFRSLVHAIGAVAISLAGSVLYFKWNPDICTGYWGFRGSALKKMRVTAKKFDLEANLFSEACKKNLVFRTVPITYSKRLGEEKLRAFSDGRKIAWKLVKERFS